ncbi:MAG: YqaA family protein [Psychrobium sp.]
MIFTLFISSFLAATLLPGGSEALLIYDLTQRPELAVTLVIVASIGNSLGSVTSYGLGIIGAKKLTERQLQSKAALWVKHYGVYSLLLSWLPLIGDVICVAAGLFKLPLWRSILFITVGKTCRYTVIAMIFFAA